MTRIKHIVKQAILDNSSFYVRFKLVKTTRAKTTREERLIKNIRSLLKDLDRKSCCYKSESTYIVKVLTYNRYINRFDNDDSERNTSISKILRFSCVETIYAKIDERNSARFCVKYSFSESHRRCFTRSSKNDAC